jgi:hypothetical protein
VNRGKLLEQGHDPLNVGLRDVPQPRVEQHGADRPRGEP